MIALQLEYLQSICKNIIKAVDTTISDIEAEVIELKTGGNCTLNLSISNNEYTVKVTIPFDDTIEPLHAVVNAKLFLNLISKVTTKTIELSTDNQTLYITANGNYKLPMIFANDKMLTIRSFEPENVVDTFTLTNENVQSIAAYNSLEILRPSKSTVEQRLYYLDNQGCVSFGAGACINTFISNASAKILLSDKVVRLFKLFEEDIITCKLGYDPGPGDVPISKVSFSTSSMTISANITSNNSYLNTFPAEFIRGEANYSFPYNLVVDRATLLSAIDRLKLFGKGGDFVITPLEISADAITVFDIDKNNKETVPLLSSVTNLTEPYNCALATKELETLLKKCTDQALTIKFGNGKHIVVARNNIVNVLPEGS